MDAIVTAALMGTAQLNKQEVATGTSLDTLLEKLPEMEAERKLLLTAGAWAMYKQTGKVAEALPNLPEAAPAERLPACTPSVAKLLQNMFQGEQDEFLGEALERLHKLGYRLPYELLPLALNRREEALRTALFPLLGERGLWLSQFNSAWSWVSNYLPGVENTLPPDAETIWQEGTVGQRKTILQLLRASDAAKAREWLEAVWKSEKAESRVELLATLEVGLSAADEAFLEKALDDRTAGVRALPPKLLARIPGSAFMTRMVSRADAMLSCSALKLKMRLPVAIDKQWERDSIVAKPPWSKMGERIWWMLQVMSFIPPTYWNEKFGLTPQELIEAAGATDWNTSLIEGWSQAALLHNTDTWFIDLWNWWYTGKKKKSDAYQGDEIREQLSTKVPLEMLEKRILELPPDTDEWQETLEALPKPWTKQFGDDYIEKLIRYVTELKITSASRPYSEPWYHSLSTASRALPLESAPLALEEWDAAYPEGDNKKLWQFDNWREEIKKFKDVLRFRLHMIEEIV